MQTCNNNLKERFMRNLLIVLFCCILTTTSAFAKCNCKPTCNCVSKKVVNDEMKFYKNYAESVKKERAAVSNALQLTEEQAQCRNELMRENTIILQEQYKKLYKETKTLNNLKTQKATLKEINTQEKVVNCTKKNIKEIVNNENKQFKKILDRDQRAKLRMIQKLQRKTIKDLDNQKDYYKSNPKMRPFGQKTNCRCK